MTTHVRSSICKRRPDRTVEETAAKRYGKSRIFARKLYQVQDILDSFVILKLAGENTEFSFPSQFYHITTLLSVKK